MADDTDNRCPSCEATMINGFYCHETGCPDAWKGMVVDCFECGCEFIPDRRYQKTCNDCLNPCDKE